MAVVSFIFYLSCRLGISLFVGWMGGHRKIGTVPSFLLSLVNPWFAFAVSAVSPRTPAWKAHLKSMREERGQRRLEKELQRQKRRLKLEEQETAPKLKKQVEELRKQVEALKAEKGKDSSGKTEVQENVSASNEAVVEPERRKGRFARLIDRIGGFMASAMAANVSEELSDGLGGDAPDGESKVSKKRPKEKEIRYLDVDDETIGVFSSLTIDDGQAPCRVRVIGEAMEYEGVEGLQPIPLLQAGIVERHVGRSFGAYSLFTNGEGGEIVLFKDRRPLVTLSRREGSSLVGCHFDYSLFWPGSPFEEKLASLFEAGDVKGLMEAVSNHNVLLSPKNIDSLKGMLAAEKAAGERVVLDNSFSLFTSLEGRRYAIVRDAIPPVDMHYLQSLLLRSDGWSDVTVVSEAKAVADGLDLLHCEGVYGNGGADTVRHPLQETVFYDPVGGRIRSAADLDLTSYRMVKVFLNDMARFSSVSAEGAVTVSVPQGSDVAFIRYGGDAVVALTYNPNCPAGIEAVVSDARLEQLAKTVGEEGAGLLSAVQGLASGDMLPGDFLKAVSDAVAKTSLREAEAASKGPLEALDDLPGEDVSYGADIVEEEPRCEMRRSFKI